MQAFQLGDAKHVLSTGIPASRLLMHVILMPSRPFAFFPAPVLKQGHVHRLSIKGRVLKENLKAWAPERHAQGSSGWTAKAENPSRPATRSRGDQQVAASVRGSTGTLRTSIGRQTSTQALVQTLGRSRRAERKFRKVQAVRSLQMATLSSFGTAQGLSD